ncbi:acyltransferase [Pseudonocardia sp. MH-G8]|nr:acyltransferase [Pseudonocardia sp. MH-G8]
MRSGRGRSGEQPLGADVTSPTAGATPSGRAGRLDWVDAAKGISILLVVAHHVVWFMQRSGQAPTPLLAANEALASLRMPLFFLASGLFVAGPLAATWRTVLHKRVALFLYLYAIWTIIRFTFFAALVPPAVDPDDSANPVSLAWALLLPGPSTWFLYALAVFAVVAKLLRPVPVALQLGAAAVLSALVGAGMLEFGDTRWAYMARFLFFFLLGCHARRLIERLADATSLLRVIMATAVCVGAAGAAVMLNLRSIPPVALILQCLAVGFGVLFAAWICRYRIGTLLVALGRQTLPIYLIHMLWLAAMMTGIGQLDLASGAAYALPVVMVPVLAALSLLTHRVLVTVGGRCLFELPPRLAGDRRRDRDRRRLLA